jgi:hypothetical protein
VLTLLVLLVALPVPTAAAGDVATLYGVVGPGFTIALNDAAGRLVTHLDPGEYVVRVDDRSGNHNFHLFGPGVDRATDVLDIGVSLWTVQLVDGQYGYVCDPARMSAR